MAYNTGNPIGSLDPRDAADNKENFDSFAVSAARTYTDRLGVQRKTVTGTLQDYAAYNLRGAWATATAYNVNDIWRDGAAGAFYLVLADYTSGATAADDIAGGNVVVHQPKDWVVSVATITDLRALEPLFDGQQASVSEEYLAGIFYFDESSSLADDGSDIIVTTGGKRWIREAIRIKPASVIDTVSAGELVDRSEDFIGVGRNFMQLIKLNQRDVNLYFIGDSTSGPSYPWVLQLAGDIADLFPTHTVNYRLFLDATGDYGSTTVVSTGAGANSINIFNASVPGATATYFCSSRRENLWVESPDLVIFNYGHNFASAATTDQIFSFMYPAVTDIMGDHPLAEYALTIQNIDTSFPEYSSRQASVVQNIASICGIGTIDFRTVFANKYYAGEISEWMSDSVHPNAAGWAVMSNIVLRSLLTDKKQNCTPTNPIKVQKETLLQNGHFFDWPYNAPVPVGFAVNGDCTVAHDYTEFETIGWSARLNNTSPSLGIMSTDQSNILDFIPRDQGLTFAARVKCPVGSGINAGRVEISLGTATLSSVPQTQGRGRWMWIAVYVTPAQLAAATQLIFRVYAGNNSDVTYVDRLTYTCGRVFNDNKFKLTTISEYYAPSKVIPKTGNDTVTINPDGGFTVVNPVDLFPGVFVNLSNLDIGATYTASWITSVAGTSSGAYVRDFGGAGALRESETPLGTDVGGDLVGELVFTAIASTAAIQVEISSSSGGTTFTITDLTIVKNP